MHETGEEDVESPVIPFGADRVVDGDQPEARILAEFAQVDRSISSTDPAEDFDDDQGKMTQLDNGFGLRQVLSI